MPAGERDARSLPTDGAVRAGGLKGLRCGQPAIAGHLPARPTPAPPGLQRPKLPFLSGDARQASCGRNPGCGS